MYQFYMVDYQEVGRLFCRYCEFVCSHFVNSGAFSVVSGATLFSSSQASDAPSWPAGTPSKGPLNSSTSLPSSGDDDLLSPPDLPTSYADGTVTNTPTTTTTPTMNTLEAKERQQLLFSLGISGHLSGAVSHWSAGTGPVRPGRDRSAGYFRLGHLPRLDGTACHTSYGVRRFLFRATTWNWNDFRNLFVTMLQFSFVAYQKSL